MQLEDCFMLGYLTRPHGVRGELKGVFDVDDINAYEQLESVYLLKGNKLIPFFVDALNILDNRNVIIGLRNVNTRDDAEELAKTELYLPLSTLPELDSFQFYFHEIKGFSIRDEKLGLLGKVQRVMEMPAQDLIVMDFEGKEVLIPITDDIILEIDRENQEVISHLPEGLIDLY